MLDLNVTNLEDDQTLQGLVLSVHHAVNHTMSAIGMAKIIENNQGKAYIRRVQPIIVQQAGPAGPQPGRAGQWVQPRPV
jgi:hypothetical protein